MALAGSDRANENTPQSNGEPKASVVAQASGDQAEKILCPHCKRTASNGIKCLGICVADSDY